MNPLARLFHKPPASPAELWVGLLAAVRDSNTERVKEILSDHPEMISRTDDKGMTALHWAAQYQTLASTACLIDHGANPHIKDNLGYVPRQVAQWYGEYRMGAYTESCLKIVDRIKKAERDSPPNDSPSVVDESSP